jgi:hypothetical protein
MKGKIIPDANGYFEKVLRLHFLFLINDVCSRLISKSVDSYL